MVAAGRSSWVVNDSVTATGASIRSGCSPGMCPAHPWTKHSNRYSFNRWQYFADEWRESDIILKCDTHKYW